MKHPWKKLLEPPGFADPDDARVARLVQAIGVTMLLATSAMAVNNLVAGQMFTAGSMALAALVTKACASRAGRDASSSA